MDELDSKKFHVITKPQKKWAIIVGLIIVLLALPPVAYKYYQFAINRTSQGFKEAQFEISEGEAVSTIAQRLYTQDLVNSEFLFKAYLISRGLHTKIQAGIYQIPAGSSVIELSEIFQHGTNDVTITFLEGWRVEEYARIAEERLHKIDYGEVVRLSKKYEGFLFPDTYFFNKDVKEQEMVDMLRTTFNEKTQKVLSGANLDKAGLTRQQAVVFASIVEREVADDEDRPIVAGILIKRWKNGQLIGADASTQYTVAHLQVCDSITLEVCPTEEQAKVLNWWPQQLSRADLDWDSPYNTRKNVGLPPSPICNPGLASLEAVIDYKETSYNYYLTDENGITHYANTLEEHNENIVAFL